MFFYISGYMSQN